MLDKRLDFDQFIQQFGTEEACAEALFRSRWPDGFRCPRCGHFHAYYITTRSYYQCSSCRYQVSLTAGTIMENTRTPLTKWFLALFFLAQPKSINATQLHKKIGVTYKTAWTMLMKIRRVMGQYEDSLSLHGYVKLTSSVYGHKISLEDSNPGEYPVLLGASIDESGTPVHFKIKRYSNHSWYEYNQAIDQFQAQHISPSSDVLLNKPPFNRRHYKEVVNLVKHAELWVNKTFIAISSKHWRKYVDEFCFRFNADIEYRDFLNANPAYLFSYTNPYMNATFMISWSMTVFNRLLQHCTQVYPVTYSEIIGERLGHDFIRAA